MNRNTCSFCYMIALAFLYGWANSVSASGPDDVRFFESKIRPVLAKHCFECHSERAVKEDNHRGGLWLDSREGVIRGGQSGPAVIPGNPEDSLLIAALRYESLQMPPDGKLPEGIIRDVFQWIKDGASWPAAESVRRTSVEEKSLDYAALRANHWAWRPIQQPPLPEVENTRWPRTAIDRFVLNRLEKAGLTPSPQADRRALLRRLYFTVIGLPPRFEEYKAFLSDKSPDAYERAVDRLLASPHFGERWGRHWLDIARYADNAGWNSQTKELYSDFHFAYTYRDYVIRAFNEDLPYDRFIVEQIAADKLGLREDNRALAALGLLTLGDKSFGVSRADQIDDCIDTISRGILGITASCARCHDHKYDPIPIEDYYSLFGVFQNSTIEVAARVHDINKCESFPLIFATKQGRDQLEDALDSAESRLDEAQRRYHQDVLKHCRARVADYLMATTQPESVNAPNGLSKDILKRWRSLIRKASNHDHSVFAPWHLLSKLNNNEKGRSNLNLVAMLESPEQGLGKKRINELIRAELARSSPQTLVQLAAVYASVFGRVLAKSDQTNRQSFSDAEREILDLLSDKESPIVVSRADALNLPIHRGEEDLKQLQKELHALKFDNPRAVALRDRDKISDTHVYVRGNPRNKGKQVRRHFLTLLSSPNVPPFEDGSGRLELANAIANEDNPLTARVIVNRIWYHHFGKGLVESTSDFGMRSDAPSHPRLLDYLAWSLIRNNWSLKSIHRRILLSATFQQASLDRGEVAQQDPENRLLWRMNRRRLEFEAQRDAMLATTGELDRTVGGPPVDAWNSNRRTVYGYVNRYRIAAAYETFDFPNSSRTAPKRLQTLIPQQALFLMNSPFVQDRASSLTNQTSFNNTNNRTERIRLLYQAVLGRDPNEQERIAADRLLADDPADDESYSEIARQNWQAMAHALYMSNEFMYVD